jgi:ribokinase
MPQIGETLMGKKFEIGFGGKGANKAVACARLGSKCAVVSKVSDICAQVIGHMCPEFMYI